MKLSRRNLLLAASALPLARYGQADDVAAGATVPASNTLPFKQGFVDSGITYLDAGSQHPISIAAQAEAHKYLAHRALDPAAAGYERNDRGVLEKYAKLVNADLDEITFVQSTTAGEQMILRALGLPESGGHIVCDTLHFFGSLPLYEEMAKQGCKVSWVRDRDGRIPLEDMKKAITPGTRLVALSLVSTINGFEHDLKAVCDMAHEAGALVFADIIHAVGCVPVDLHASGVDFASGASYKWLMGEFGLGFMYVRKEVQAQLKRTNYGYYGMSAFQSHIYPFDPPGDTIADYAFQDNATGLFALGTHAHTAIAILNSSLDYIHSIGVENIQAHAQTLVSRLKQELPERGYTLMTPLECTTPMVACALENARGTLGPKLREANIRTTVSSNRFRVSVSVFNDMGDIDRLLDVLGRA
ncbi:MAG TPA: aminotransferase class V-fold PLP-dependent enzyme [Xanthomonadales bacterium]|nr:aminotransferase class V-fold PLP-dependent enzyme [Xanthomonadales bacterium]